MLANSFCAFFSFMALVLVGFFLLDLKAVFMSERISLTANVSHGTLDFVLCLIGMNSAAASKWTTKFSYSSFGLCVSVFSCCDRGNCSRVTNCGPISACSAVSHL